MNRIDQDGPEAGYAACVAAVGSQPLLQDAPLRIGVSVGTSTTWRLESQEVKYQWRQAFGSFFFVRDWVAGAWTTVEAGQGVKQVVVHHDEKETSPVLGDTYMDYRLVLTSSVPSSERYTVYVNDALFKPTRFSGDSFYLATEAGQDGIFLAILGADLGRFATVF